MDLILDYWILAVTAGTTAVTLVVATVAREMTMDFLKWLFEKTIATAWSEWLKAKWAKHFGKKPTAAQSNGVSITNSTVHIHQSPAPPQTEAPALPAPPATIPVDRTRLPEAGEAPFGRGDDITTLEKLRQADKRVIAIIGQGGEGKTALLRGWLDHLQAQDWGGARRVWCWSFYNQGTEGQGSSDTFMDQALRAFGAAEPLPLDGRERGRMLARLVGKGPILLVLDGLEPLQAPPGPDHGRIRDPGLDALLKGLRDQPAGLCLITSRAPLLLTGTAIASHDLLQLSEVAGAQVLTKLGVIGSQEELEQASKDLHGHALSLTLLGSFLAEIHQGAIARRDQVDLLRADDICGTGHASRVLDSYVQALSPQHLAILDMIGLFDRPATPALLSALRDPPIPGLTDSLAEWNEDQWKAALSHLRRSRLLLPADNTGTVDAHPLIRTYFHRRRHGSPAARAGHDRLYQTLCAQAKDQPDTLEEMAPLLQAIRHGCAAGKEQETLDEVYYRRLMREGASYLSNILGALGECIDCLAPFFDGGWEQPTTAVSDADQAFLLNEIGQCLRALGRWQETEAALCACVQRHIYAKSWQNAARSTINLAELLLASGRVPEAVVMAQQCMDYAALAGLEERLSQEATLARTRADAGQNEAAVHGFERAEALEQQIQPKIKFLYSLRGHDYCRLLLDQGKAAEVVERASAALEISTRNGWLFAIGQDHQSLGQARAHLGQWRQAAKHFDQTISHLQRASIAHFLAAGHVARAGFRRQTGQWELAKDDLAVAADIAEPAGMKLILTDIALERAQLTLAQGDRPTARRHLDDGAALVQECGYHRHDGLVEKLRCELGEGVRAPQLV